MTKKHLAVLFLAFAACGGKKDDKSSSSGGGDKPAAASSTKLGKLGLSIDFPGDVSDAIGGDGQMIMGEDGVLTVEETKAKKSEADAKSDADMYSPKNFKSEKLADGWAVTYDNSGSMGANYFVTVQRDIGGKTYTCSTTAPKEDQAKAVLAACKSLKKA
jgi:hypothetical protein